MENKAPGPNGFPMNVFKVFWGVIGGDVMGAMKEFHKKKKAALWRTLNTSFIALIPKMKGDDELKDLRPISLLGSFYKF